MQQRGSSLEVSFIFFKQALLIVCFLFQTKVMGQWYIIPSTCDVALDFQMKIEGQWNVMPRACGRRNVALYMRLYKLARFMP